MADIQTWVIWGVWVAVNIALGMSVGIWAAILIPGWRALLATPIRVDEAAIDQMALLAEDRAELDGLIMRWRDERRRAWWIIGLLTALWLIYPSLLLVRALDDVGAMTFELALVGAGLVVGLAGVLGKRLWTRADLRPLVPVAADWRWATGSYRARERELRQAMARLGQAKAQAEREKDAAEREWVGEAEQAEQLQERLAQMEEEFAAQLAARDALIDALNARLAPELRMTLDGEVASGDPVAALQAEITRAWHRRYTAEDRERFPLRPVTIGWDFLESLDRHGVARDKLMDVCVDVATRRVHQVRGREPHRLRVGGGGNDEVRIRARDGAKAWRCALKRNAPQAPRLHWWEIEGGGVELACVTRHDDFSIPE